jgi:hypothetical protein
MLSFLAVKKPSGTPQGLAVLAPLYRTKLSFVSGSQLPMLGFRQDHIRSRSLREGLGQIST